MKVCTQCKEAKEEVEFSFDKRNKCGLQSACRECQRNANRQRYNQNRETLNKKAQVWRDENREYVRKRARRQYRKIKDSKEWKDRHRVFVNRWKSNNPDKVKAINNRHDARKRTTARGKLSHAMSRDINASIRRGSKDGRTWESLAGYTIEQLKVHLEKQFSPGMSWENYGSYWHIDHKTPESAFNFETPEDIDFKRCWAMKNLQPLEAKANMIKGAKVERPFQPSLTIEAYEERV